jgi:hypothetical protein
MEVERSELIKWADALDILCPRGITPTTASCREGLLKARACAHPDALWLCSLFPVDEVTLEHVLEVMNGQGNDPRALFVRSCASEEDADELRRAADLGYAPAQARLAFYHDDMNERFRWAHMAASQDNRDGLYLIAECYDEALGCERNEAMSAAAFKSAAELGQVMAQCAHGDFAFAASDWRRYYWFGKSVLGGHYDAALCLIDSVVDVIARFESGGPGQSAFEIGSVFKVLLNIERQTVLEDMDIPEEWPQEWLAIQQCMRLHDEWLAAAKAAVDCWVGIARQTKVVPTELRVMIAQWIWAQRVDWNA